MRVAADPLSRHRGADPSTWRWSAVVGLLGLDPGSAAAGSRRPPARGARAGCCAAAAWPGILARSPRSAKDSSSGRGSTRRRDRQLPQGPPAPTRRSSETCETRRDVPRRDHHELFVDFREPLARRGPLMMNWGLAWVYGVEMPRTRRSARSNRRGLKRILGIRPTLYLMANFAHPATEPLIHRGLSWSWSAPGCCWSAAEALAPPAARPRPRP